MPSHSRREFLKNTSRIAATSALASVAMPHVHAAENNTIQVALVGCGGRGTGAAANALATKSGPIKLVAMADVFEQRLSNSYASLMKAGSNNRVITPKTVDSFVGGFHTAQVDVPPERRFVGFDAYQQAMDCLRPGDVVILATPCAFRSVHFRRAIDRGLNVFMEKPTTVDGPSTRRMLALAAESVQKNLKVSVGLMCRHCKARKALLERIRSGQIGEILSMRTYRLQGPAGLTGLKPNDLSELLFQVKHFLGFLWAGGGLVHDHTSHNIDECCWMKGAWPIQAIGSAGRCVPHGKSVDQNFDHYNVEYTFADGTEFHMQSRTVTGCYSEFASYARGTKGLAVISTFMHTPAKCRIYQGQKIDPKNLVWAFPQPESNPYQLEWDDLIDAIRNDKPHNEAQRGAEASLTQIMGRMACHTGQLVTWKDALDQPHEFAANLDQLTMDSPAPLQPSPDGKYPLPQPGLFPQREY